MTRCGRTVVSYLDEHAVMRRKQDDGSVLAIAYRFGKEDGRRIIPRAAVENDPETN